MTEAGKFNPYHTTGGEMFSAMRRLFLGKKFPPRYTRIICNLGIISFLYHFCWYAMVLMLLDFGTGLPKYEMWDKWFMFYGEKYGIFDIHFSFNTFVICQLAFSIAMLVGITLVWRQKMAGYIITVASSALLMACPLLILGLPYFQHEVKTYEWILASVIALLFLIGYFVERKKRKIR
jgi:hypothetical protein